MAPTLKIQKKSTGKRARPSHHYTEEAIEAAVKSVKEGKPKSEAARLHNVPRTTLLDRLSGRPPRSKIEKTVLSTNEESLLADWIKKSAYRGFGRTKSQVLASVQAVVKAEGRTTPFKDGKPGSKWFKLFMKRHSDICIGTPQALGAQRAGVTVEKIQQWFHNAYQDITSVDATILSSPHRIFNCDESGFQLGGGITKVLTDKSKKQVYQVTTGTQQQVTVLACGNASGDVHPPLLIFPGQRSCYDPMDGFPEAHYARSTNGRIDSLIFLRWIERAFIPETKDLEKPLVLFVDGHKTHVTLKVCQMCKDNGVILYQLPSHSSHIVQPLDLTTMKTLKQAWREEVSEYQTLRSDFLGKKDFAKVFRKAWERGIKRNVVVSGFRAAGLYPWNPEYVDLIKTEPSGLFSNVAATPAINEDDDIVTEEKAVIPLSPPELRENISSSHHDPNVIVGEAHDLGQSNPLSASCTSSLSPSLPPLPTKNISTPLPLSSAVSVTSNLQISSPLPTSSFPPPLISTVNISSPLPTSSFPPPLISTVNISSSLPTSPNLPTSSSVTLSTLPSSSFSTSFPPSRVPTESMMKSSLPSSSSPLPTSSYGEDFQKLLLLVANINHQTLAHRIAVHDTGSPTADPEEVLFNCLYGRINELIQRTDGRTQLQLPSFQTIVLPSRWKKTKSSNSNSNVTFQPTNMLTSDQFIKYKADTIGKKREEEEEKERKKKEREEKNVNEEKKKRKREKQERKKKEREDKKKQKVNIEKKKSKKSVMVRKEKVHHTADPDVQSLSSGDCVKSDDSLDGLHIAFG